MKYRVKATYVHEVVVDTESPGFERYVLGSGNWEPTFRDQLIGYVRQDWWHTFSEIQVDWGVMDVTVEKKVEKEVTPISRIGRNLFEQLRKWKV